MDLSVPDTVDNRYKVLEVIGTGAMATVYAAEDTRLGRKVALKILRPEQAQDDTFRARFKREAEAVASLNNPAIVAVYDTGSYNPSQDGGESASSEEGTAIPYIVMEYVEGHTLRSILSRGGHLPVRDALGYSEQLLGALQYSHSMGIIHRDIKPANIMVLERTSEDIAKGQPGQIKVMDFGISRAIEEAGEALTKANVVMGSARYMSPEQVSGKEVDARSDLYSAACVIYEMIAGRSPFDAESNVDLAAKHLSDAPEPPSKFTPLEVPAGLDAVILKGLAKNPDERYQSAAEFAQALVSVVRPGEETVVQDAAMTTAFVPSATTASLGDDYAPYTTSITEASVEDGGLNGFFEYEDDEELYDDEEYAEYDESLPRKRAWVRFLVGTLIAALLFFSVGSVLYYQNKLNEVPQVPVPAVVNVSRDDAENQLRNLGFVLEYRQGYSDNVKKGDVISVEPGVGSKVNKGSTVVVTVSNGPEKVKLPDNLQGQSEAYVRNALKDLGLVDGRVSTVESASVPAGMVVELSPEKGSTDDKGAQTVEAGSTVNIVLSSGKVKVPSLVGLTKDQAIAALTAQDVLLNTNIETVQTNERPAGTVISQSSAAGTLVAQNSTVTIRVAATPTQTTAPTTAATQPAAATGNQNATTGNQNQQRSTAANQQATQPAAATGNQNATTGNQQRSTATATPAPTASATAGTRTIQGTNANTNANNANNANANAR
ncbi:serine/threonine protein kinase [Rothia sp. HMSC066H02]|uniref:Stk1 family PASTA domain-containing Ser/Thr kinase n=1 Tax=unclassified Rothia (in: high G+C Gram-positive bacteria) TaxID=2689056 RepID=UPI0008A150AB|nr:MULTISPECIES: Stk1 family PASTA domain-containing Ser/Thr kinase [unclassified Rothia (in: high G+C Gram-positive bacteria)]OFO94187.1 serine/threonine protein kinase [Rothia sp. HMSC065D09]OFP12311.1 serine/threonine protein kinase [Rothia sp. HMSC066H02]